MDASVFHEIRFQSQVDEIVTEVRGDFSDITLSNS